MQHVENDLDTTMDKLTSTSSKLDEKDKAFQVAEAEIQALLRKLSLLIARLVRSRSSRPLPVTLLAFFHHHSWQLTGCSKQEAPDTMLYFLALRSSEAKCAAELRTRS